MGSIRSCFIIGLVLHLFVQIFLIKYTLDSVAEDVAFISAKHPATIVKDFSCNTDFQIYHFTLGNGVECVLANDLLDCVFPEEQEEEDE